MRAGGQWCGAGLPHCCSRPPDRTNQPHPNKWVGTQTVPALPTLMVRTHGYQAPVLPLTGSDWTSAGHPPPARDWWPAQHEARTTPGHPQAGPPAPPKAGRARPCPGLPWHVLQVSPHTVGKLQDQPPRSSSDTKSQGPTEAPPWTPAPLADAPRAHTGPHPSTHLGPTVPFLFPFSCLRPGHKHEGPKDKVGQADSARQNSAAFQSHCQGGSTLRYPPPKSDS